MRFNLQADINNYLQNAYPACFTAPFVAKLAKEFSSNSVGKVEQARLIYECVRDRYPHTFDIGADEVSVTAQDVIRNGHGICYAKSNLLAALMRSVGIPAGFCYQLLVMDDVERPYIIVHALNAIYIEGKWIRLDARGNKDGVNALFSLDEEKLAFPVRQEFGEKIIDTIFYEPNKNTVKVLENSKTAQQLLENLPSEL